MSDEPTNGKPVLEKILAEQRRSTQLQGLSTMGCSCAAAAALAVGALVFAAIAVIGILFIIAVVAAGAA